MPLSSSSHYSLHNPRAFLVMARTLPWLKNATTNAPQPARPKPAKRQRMLDPASDSDDNAPRAVAKPKKQAAPTAGNARQTLCSYIGLQLYQSERPPPRLHRNLPRKNLCVPACQRTTSTSWSRTNSTQSPKHSPSTSTTRSISDCEKLPRSETHLPSATSLDPSTQSPPCAKRRAGRRKPKHGR